MHLFFRVAAVRRARGHRSSAGANRIVQVAEVAATASGLPGPRLRRSRQQNSSRERAHGQLLDDVSAQQPAAKLR